MDLKTTQGKLKLGLYIGIGVGVLVVLVKLKSKLGARGKILRKLGGKGKNTLTNDKKGNAEGTNTQLVYDPEFDAKQLKTAMDGWGTSEKIIWNTLSGLDKTKAKAVETYFNTYLGEGDSLDAWFKGDLSTSDYNKAMAYFK